MRKQQIETDEVTHDMQGLAFDGSKQENSEITCHHTLWERSDGWLEYRSHAQPGVLCHFRNMLVLQTQSVRAPGLMFFVLVQYHESLTTARITRNCVHGEWSTLRQNSSICERTRQANETSGVATRIGNSFGCLERRALFRADLYRRKRVLKGMLAVTSEHDDQ
jgi:hypothetical protein